MQETASLEAEATETTERKLRREVECAREQEVYKAYWKDRLPEQRIIEGCKKIRKLFY